MKESLRYGPHAWTPAVWTWRAATRHIISGCVLALVFACRHNPAIVDPVESPQLAANAVASRLPLLAIRTTDGNEIDSREVYVGAAYTLADTFGVVRARSSLEIRGRGNSSWSMPKKPYHLRLASSASFLGMPSGRHWVLLPNYADKTLMRNDVAFRFSRALSFEYTPRADFVDVEVNGSYEGIYQLGEHIRIAPDRVDIPELQVGDTTAATVTGGYLIEIDDRRDSEFCVDSEHTIIVFCVKDPDSLTDPRRQKQHDYIISYIHQTENAIFGERFADASVGYAAFLDVPSMVEYYVLQEYFRNIDGNLALSTYLFKKRGGKLHFGPVWDFDLAIGNANYGDADQPQGWHIRTAPWFERLFEDPAFAAAVRSRWRQLIADGSLTRLDAHIEGRRKWLSKVQLRNFSRWPILDTWVWPNRVVTGSYDGEVNAMRQWLTARRSWMDQQFR